MPSLIRRLTPILRPIHYQVHRRRQDEEKAAMEEAQARAAMPNNNPSDTGTGTGTSTSQSPEDMMPKRVVVIPPAHQIASIYKTERLVPATDSLATFRYLIGISSAAPLNTLSILRRPGRNLGIYQRVVTAERKACLRFRIFSNIINLCLGLQIVIAAALTALGAANGPKGAVTVFGAFNTIIAGFLTYLKGSGLPNRYKYFENEWRKVREYIEQRERDFGREGCGDSMDVEYEIGVVERMYESVRADVEVNEPDSYVSTGKLSARAGGGGGGVMPEPSLAGTRRIGAGAGAGAGGADAGPYLHHQYHTHPHPHLQHHHHHNHNHGPSVTEGVVVAGCEICEKEREKEREREKEKETETEAKGD